MLFTQNVIRHFLPHRYPFVMVERVHSFTGGDAPALDASFVVSADTYIFKISQESTTWPSAFVIEGLGQSCALLSIVWALQKQCISKGMAPEGVFELLHQFEESPDLINNDVSSESPLGDVLPGIPYNNLLASVNLDILNEAYIGDTIHYKVTRSHSLNDMSRFAVHARVEERDLVQGFLVGTTNSL